MKLCDQYKLEYYRHLVSVFTKVLYRSVDHRSILGFLWSFINPLFMAVILYLVFQHWQTGLQDTDNINSKSEYFLYILIGTIIWNFMVTATGAALNSLTCRSDAVRNLAFPKEIIVISQVNVHAIRHLQEWFLVIILSWVLGFHPNFVLLLFPLIFLLIYLFVLALSLPLALLNAFARDCSHIWNMLTRICFFLVPVFYSPNQLPSSLAPYIQYNPLSILMQAAREILIRGNLYSDITLLFPCLCTLILLVFGFLMFKRFEQLMVERI